MSLIYLSILLRSVLWFTISLGARRLLTFFNFFYVYFILVVGNNQIMTLARNLTCFACLLTSYGTHYCFWTPIFVKILGACNLRVIWKKIGNLVVLYEHIQFKGALDNSSHVNWVLKVYLKQIASDCLSLGTCPWPSGPWRLRFDRWRLRSNFWHLRTDLWRLPKTLDVCRRPLTFTAGLLLLSLVRWRLPLNIWCLGPKLWRLLSGPWRLSPSLLFVAEPGYMLSGVNRFSPDFIN